MVLGIVLMGFVLMNVLNGLCWVRCGGGFCRLKNFVFFALGVVGCVVGFIFCPYLLIAFCGFLFIYRGRFFSLGRFFGRDLLSFAGDVL
jgi:hypothetical protein